MALLIYVINCFFGSVLGSPLFVHPNLEQCKILRTSKHRSIAIYLRIVKTITADEACSLGESFLFILDLLSSFECIYMYVISMYNASSLRALPTLMKVSPAYIARRFSSETAHVLIKLRSSKRGFHTLF